jgi:hypothetical protein
MNAKSRRRICGYIWNEQMARLYKAHDEIRTITAGTVDLLEQHPPSVRLLLTYVAQIALHLNAAAAALREIERIAQEYREE